MAQFFSDLFTYTTLGVAAGAVFLSDINASEPADALTSDRIAAETQSGELVQQAKLVTVLNPVQPADLSAIPEADLLTVTFAAANADIDLPQVSTDVSDMGLVTAQAVNLRAGPGTNFAVVGRALRDERYAVTGDREGIWHQIVLPDQDAPAWVHGKFFKAPEQIASN